MVPQRRPWPARSSVSRRPHADDVRDRGAVVDTKAADLRFVLDQLAALDAGSTTSGADPLAGRLDLGRVGVFGHSFGGGAARGRLPDRPRVTAGANLDGGLWREAERAAVDRPFLLVFADHPEFVQPCAEAVAAKFYSSVEWCEQDRALHLAAWQRLVESARPGACVQIRDAEHRTFMDWRLLPAPALVDRPARPRHDRRRPACGRRPAAACSPCSTAT